VRPRPSRLRHLGRLRRLAARCALSGAALLGGIWLLDHFFPPPLEALHRAPAVVVMDREGEPLRAFLAPDQRWRFPVTLDEVPEELVAALVASEDQRFFAHPGVDLLAVGRAVWSNVRAGRVVSGASTIPMQLARLARPAPRTLGAKVREALRALQLEHRLGKRELLELYLNRLPYGGNLEGVGAASFFYFGKRPRQLSVGEMALLVALPRSPAGYDPTRNPEAARAARDRVLERLAEEGVFSREQVEEARRQGVPTHRRPPPFAAPHFTRRLRGRGGSGGSVPTTLDRRVQSVAEATLASRVRDLRREGIGNAAAVVLELDGLAVRSWVGSADFFDEAHAGQVDGVVARRSPGSALKPFLYALAYDEGWIVPDSFLLDVPTDYAGYVAENYDGTYRGQVSARTALAASLNAPAVRLLARVGLEDFHALLLRGGLTTLDQPPARYGLPLALGAGEVTLLDLTHLYASLAAGGLHEPMGMLPRPETERGESPPAIRLFSHRAAELVTETLVDLARPDLPEAWDLARGAPTVAWKTGTSFGHRDAWAVGFSGRYAIGVWVGNFDGRPIQGISGAHHAGPLLFDLFRALGDHSRPALLNPDPGHALDGQARLLVCSVSRELPGPYCPKRLAVPYLPGTTHLPPCSVHRRVFLDRETGQILAGPCLGRRPYRAAVLTAEPPELLAWRRSRGEAVTPLPGLSPECGGPPAAEPPKIVSPDGATPFLLRPEAPLAFQRIPLIARAGSFSHTLYWYQDGLLVATAPVGERRFLALRPGRHEIILVDDTGRSDRVVFRVEGKSGE